MFYNMQEFLNNKILQQVICPSWPTWGMPFMASTLQIGGYHSYQHRKL